MTPLCRAALWYCDNVHIGSTRLHGIKALRECKDVRLRGCDIISAEFGWSSRGIEMTGCSAESEYFMLRASELTLRDVRMTGKYSFQYIEDAVSTAARSTRRTLSGTRRTSPSETASSKASIWRGTART